MREYAAVRKEIRANIPAKIVQYERIPVMSMISASRLIEGGAAMFAAIRRNHHNAIAGNRGNSPLLMRSLRE